MELLNRRILKCLRQEKVFALATIMTHDGSTPRTSGSKMIVLNDRTIYGTIGGGLIEALVIDASIDMIKKKKCQIKEFSLNKSLKHGLDMICGGNLSILIETFIRPSDNTAALTSSAEAVFNAVTDLEKTGGKGFLISLIKGFSKSDFTTEKCLVLPDGTITGNNLKIPSHLIEEIKKGRFKGPSPVIYNHNLKEYIIEPVQPGDIIYIFGAGHVGFYLAQMARLSDFQVVVTDDRHEFANRERFPHAEEIRVIEKFKNAFDSLLINEHSYIVILTRGHLYDQTVLEHALNTSAAYIGMIGSERKKRQIYNNLQKKGVTENSLRRVYSPIGIEIHSETPSEIAVSIIGEIIKVRAEK